MPDHDLVGYRNCRSWKQRSEIRSVLGGWLVRAMLLLLTTSCATTGLPPKKGVTQPLRTPSSPRASQEARVVYVTGVQVQAKAPGEAAIVVTANGPLVDYESFALHDPPRLVIGLPHARHAISQPVNLPAGSPILSVQILQYQEHPVPMVHLVFNLKALAPYRLELSDNNLQILVSADAAEQAPLVQGPKPVVSPSEPPGVRAVELPVVSRKDRKERGLTVFGATPTASETNELAPDLHLLGSREAARVRVAIGRSVVVDLSGQIQRVSVTNPEIADIQLIPPSQILVSGKTPGITTLIAWANEERQYIDIVVTADLSLLQQAMKEIAPQEEIQVKATQTSVVLSGTVSTPSLTVKAAEVAKAFLPDKAGVINLLHLGEPHQIMLKVEVAEVNRTALRELGLDFLNLGNTFALGVFGGTTAGVLNTVLNKDGTVTFDPRTSLFFAKGNTKTFLRALEQKGLAKSLARPTLIAASGADATFLVGGEFPYPVVQGGAAGTAASVTIQFKPFGVRLNFTPTLNDLGSINLKIEPEVSALDFSHAVTISGFNVPSLTTRRARTIVDLRPGQSLAMGGLIQTEDRKTLTKFPILGDIPVLGALFRSTNFIRNETDLVIFVTPEIVKPFEAGQAPNLEVQMKTTPEEAKEIRQIPGR